LSSAGQLTITGMGTEVLYSSGCANKPLAVRRDIVLPLERLQLQAGLEQRFRHTELKAGGA
jgi:hypothetical protein